MHIKLEAVITELCTSPQRSWASGLHCSPHTSLMAIGGHYGPPMTHRLLVQAARRSPEAHTLGFSSAAAASVFFFSFLLLLLSLRFIFASSLLQTLTHCNANTHAKCCLPAVR